jgi:hypothetical protein
LGQTTTTTPCLAPLPQVRIVSWFCSTTLLLLVSFNIFCYIVVGPRRNICVSTFVLWSYTLCCLSQPTNTLALCNLEWFKSEIQLLCFLAVIITDSWLSLSHKPAADWFKRFFFFGGSDFLTFSAASRFMPLSLSLSQTSWFKRFFCSFNKLVGLSDFLSFSAASRFMTLSQTSWFKRFCCSFNSLVGLSNFLCIWAASRDSWLSQANWFKHSLFTQLVGWVVGFFLVSELHLFLQAIRGILFKEKSVQILHFAKLGSSP